ncbi:CHAD domain-containing protein [candidate division KSB1 bacterium]|nr:CHAD domain-containing protein [candidate division KSB1 bacterium]
MDFGPSDSPPDPALCRFAAKAIRKRLRALAKEHAGARAAKDPECVHRMRVASRRLNIALNQFAPCFPERQFKRWHAALRRLRQALGDARDLDVQIRFLESLLPTITMGTPPLTEGQGGGADSSESPPNSIGGATLGHPPVHGGAGGGELARHLIPGIVRVLLRKRQRRERLQKEVIRAIDRFEDDDILHGIRAGILAIHDSDEEADAPAETSRELTAMAGLAIQERLDELLQWERCVNDPDRIDDHHAMRIAAKHLRYTMELFGPVFADELKADIEICKACQELLGNIHDADVWIDQLPRFIEKERGRTLDYHGHGKPMETLLPGIQWLDARCRSARHEQFAAFQERWRKLRADRVWEQLSNRVSELPPAPNSAAEPE